MAYLRKSRTHYLQKLGVPVGDPGSSATLVDSSFKGAVQEHLSALFPETIFQGRYIFYGAARYDPHPHTKTGYALHLGDADRSNGGLPLPELPSDTDLIFACRDAIAGIECICNGPLESPTAVSLGRPIQIHLHRASNPAWGINPIRIGRSFTNPLLREAVKVAALLAVEEVSCDATGDIISYESTEPAIRYQDQVRLWCLRAPGRDPDFEETADSFVPRADRFDVERVRQEMNSLLLLPDEVDRVWEHFDRLDLHGKQGFTIDQCRDRSAARTR
jgi:hypothetical protein